MLLIFPIRVAFHRGDEEERSQMRWRGSTWWPPRSEHREVYDFNLELDVSTHLDSLPPSPSPLRSSACTQPPSPPSPPPLIPPLRSHITNHLFIFPPLHPPTTPTFFLSPTPPAYLFFHQIELAESKGIPTIPSQS